MHQDKMKNQSKRIVKYFASSIVNGVRHYYVASYDKVLDVTIRPQDFFFKKSELKTWI